MTESVVVEHSGGIRRECSAARLVGGTLILLATAMFSAVPAEARPTASRVALGACTNSTGVTVVVDYSAFGQGIVTRCVAWPVATGADALARAGFSVTQPSRTPGFMCRINGLPTKADDACTSTPPQSAYWGYYYAPNHGGWAYSSTGAWNHQPIKGGYEGWRFQKSGSKGQPGVAPSHSVPAPPAPSPSSSPTPHQTSGPSTSGPSTFGSTTHSGNGASKAKNGTTSPTKSTGSKSRSAKQQQKRHKQAQSDDNPTGEETTTSPSATTDASNEVKSASSTEHSDQDSGSPVGTIAGAGLVAVLAGAAGLVVWRRRLGQGTAGR
jgi:hypothetical protein